jgi:hypothetical protein
MVAYLASFPDWAGFGEWPWANILFAIAFFVALAGIVGIAVYILRKDRINRAAIDDVASIEGH